MYMLGSYVRNDMLLPSSASTGTPGSRTAARHKPLKESQSAKDSTHRRSASCGVR